MTMLAMLPMLFAFTACSDDDDLPQVDFDFTYENATVVDNTVYVVQGTTFDISAITVTNREEGKGCGISYAAYYWDYLYLGTTVEPPYGFEIELAEDTPLGKHNIEVRCQVFAVDKTIANAVVSIDVVVVASADDIPQTGTPGQHVSPQISATDK